MSSQSQPKKRKLPASLGLEGGGRTRVPNVSPPPTKRQAVEQQTIQKSRTYTIRSPPPVVAITSRAHKRTDEQATAHDVTDVAAAKAALPSISPSSHLAVPPLSPPASSTPSTHPHAHRRSTAPFPLLSLPTDVLSSLLPYCHIWDAFFLRCTCKTLRKIAGLNTGNEIGQDERPTSKQALTPPFYRPRGKMRRKVDIDLTSSGERKSSEIDSERSRSSQPSLPSRFSDSNTDLGALIQRQSASMSSSQLLSFPSPSSSLSLGSDDDDDTKDMQPSRCMANTTITEAESVEDDFRFGMGIIHWICD